MKLTGIDHVALTCASIEATMKWYVDTLGFEHVFPGEWNGVPVFLKLGATYLALFPMTGARQPAEQRPGFDHLAFSAATRAEFAGAQAELDRRRIDFKFRDHGVSLSVYFADPDGRKVEITTYDVAPRL